MNEQDLVRELAGLPCGPAASVITTAVEALAEAVNQMPEGQPPESYPLAALWRQSGRFHINIWTHDLGRTLHGVARALGSVKASPLPPAGVDEIEVALWRLDAGREKIQTIGCLTLGVPLLKLIRDKPSGKCNRVDFEVDGKALGKKLDALSATHPDAGRLNTVLKRLWAHDAINRRNEVTHELAQVVEVSPVGHLQFARVRQRTIQSWEWKSHYSNAAPFTAGSLQPADVIKQTFRAIVLAFDLELQAVDLLTGLVRAAAKLEPWQCVFYDETSGIASLIDPERSGLGSPGPERLGLGRADGAWRRHSRRFRPRLGVIPEGSPRCPAQPTAGRAARVERAAVPAAKCFVCEKASGFVAAPHLSPSDGPGSRPVSSNRQRPRSRKPVTHGSAIR